jgi:hypothetical protein
MLHDALLYDELDDGYVLCNLCAHRCQIKGGWPGNLQGARKPRGQTIHACVWEPDL